MIELIDPRLESGILNLLFVELISDDLQLMGCLFRVVGLLVQKLLQGPLFQVLNQCLWFETALFEFVILMLPQPLHPLLLPYPMFSVQLLCPGSANDRFKTLVGDPEQLLVKEFLAGCLLVVVLLMRSVGERSIILCEFLVG